MKRLLIIQSLLVLTIIVQGCGSGATVFLHDEYNFQFLERVAIVPFDNLSKDKGAGARTTRIFMSELLAGEVFDVVEPGEVTLALSKFSTLRTSELSTEQTLELGRKLRVQGVFFGTITESSRTRSGSATVNRVAMVVRLVETETGQTIWSSTVNAGGRGFWASLFGSGGKSSTEVMRDCVRKALGTLID